MVRIKLIIKMLFIDHQVKTRLLIEEITNKIMAGRQTADKEKFKLIMHNFVLIRELYDTTGDILDHLILIKEMQIKDFLTLFFASLEASNHSGKYKMINNRKIFIQRNSHERDSFFRDIFR